MGFTPFGGGLISSVVASLGDAGAQVVTGIGQPTPGAGGFASFAINTLLASTVQATTGYSLDSGENYLLSQLGSVLPPDENTALYNSVITQVGAAGIQQVSGFVSQGIPQFGGLFGSNVTTAGLGSQSARTSKSIPDAIASTLPAADYGGRAHTLNDIVFTLVPANAGAQTAPVPQTAPSIPLNTAFSSESFIPAPALSALKSQAALAGPASGVTFNTAAFGKNTPQLVGPNG